MNEIPPFDMNAPMDAPIRAREMRERQEREEATRRMNLPANKRKLRKIVKEAWTRVCAANSGEGQHD